MHVQGRLAGGKWLCSWRPPTCSTLALALLLPQVLKKKFDDIFAATKYTKASQAVGAGRCFWNRDQISFLVPAMPRRHKVCALPLSHGLSLLPAVSKRHSCPCFSPCPALEAPRKLHTDKALQAFVLLTVPRADVCTVQALEALRKLRTEKAQEVKELKLKLEHTKTLKDQAAVRPAADVFLDGYVVWQKLKPEHTK